MMHQCSAGRLLTGAALVHHDDPSGVYLQSLFNLFFLSDFLYFLNGNFLCF